MKLFRWILLCSLSFILLGTILAPLLYDKMSDTSELLITEVMVDQKNRDYDYIELYNHTTQIIDLADYVIHSDNLMNKKALSAQWRVEQPFLLQPNQVVVIWLTPNGKSTHKVADFNSYYRTNLTEGKSIIKAKNNGLITTKPRRLSITTNVGDPVSTVTYEEDSNGEAFTYSHISFGLYNSWKMKMEKPTPGTYANAPVLITKKQDKHKPTYKNITKLTSTPEITPIPIKLKASDKEGIRSIKVIYKNNNQPKEKITYLQKSDKNDVYTALLYPPDYIGSSVLSYYFEISDGTHIVTSDEYRIKIEASHPNEAIRLHAPPIASGMTTIKGGGKDQHTKLFINNKEMKNTNLSIEHDAYVAFEISHTNQYFKNAVTIGNEVLDYMDDTIKSYVTKTIHVPSSLINQGEDLEIDIRSGNKFSPFQDIDQGVRDGFYVKNVRLILSDGTTLYDQTLKNKQIHLGSKKTFATFTFSIPAEAFDAATYEWDTRKQKDGTYELKAVNGNNVKTQSITIDNTPPILITAMKEKTYKGQFTIDAQATDAVSGKVDVQATLDDKAIPLPYQTASTTLPPGNHLLILKSTDEAGNEVEKSISFQTTAENPLQPDLINPKTTKKVRELHPELSVSVDDPTKDKLDVTFFKGARYTPADKKHMRIFTGSADTEPPKTMMAKGERPVTTGERKAMTTLDENTFKTKHSTKFPYHRFEVHVDEQLTKQDQVKLKWNGSSLEGRKVTMYVWNVKNRMWDEVTYQIADEKPFSLEAFISPINYIEDNVIQVMVQDEIFPFLEKDYEYSFVWMSDTQYYSEHYPDIQRYMVEWVVSNRDQYNIQYVFHTGDLVDEAYDTTQWENADKTFKLFDNYKMPYGVLAGNHDVDHKTGDYSAFKKWFGTDRFQSQPTYGGSYKNNQGHYDLVSAAGNDYVMLYMGWNIGEEEIEWLNKIITMYADRKVILNVHEYLLTSGSRSLIGEQLFNEVVVPNKNVIAVLCGHYYDSETLIDEIDDDNDGIPDRRVYQMMANYQGITKGGNGYLRLLLVDQDTNTIDVKTYSPYVNDWNYYDPKQYPNKDEFTMKLNLWPAKKVVETDYFEVSVYTNDVIGHVNDLAAGDIATVTWPNLRSYQQYSWYALVQDQFEGKNYSEIWTFKTGALPEMRGGPQVP
ncbi:MAG: metallophosphoesterase [Bacillaceae bacterium]